MGVSGRTGATYAIPSKTGAVDVSADDEVLHSRCVGATAGTAGRQGQTGVFLEF